jgi:hypothetical protein
MPERDPLDVPLFGRTPKAICPGCAVPRSVPHGCGNKGCDWVRCARCGLIINQQGRIIHDNGKLKDGG